MINLINEVKAYSPGQFLNGGRFCMIDEKKLNEAYRNKGFYSLQLSPSWKT